MSITSYLPSPQFSVILTSVLVAAGLIWVADFYTSPPSAPSIAPAQNPSVVTGGGMDWKAALAAIQGEPTLPTPPSEETVANLLAASESSNITNTIGRSILVSLGEAKAQGLGSDIPTQERIVADSLAKVEAAQEVELYVLADLTIVPDSPESLKTYGNAVVTIMEGYPSASMEKALLAVATAIDSGDPASLADLTNVGSGYQGAANDLALLSVPQTLSPVHLQIVNNLSRIAASCTDMKASLTDPLRGLGGLQLFQSTIGETGRLFINIAQILKNNGILFSESEPGAAWSLLVEL